MKIATLVSMICLAVLSFSANAQKLGSLKILTLNYNCENVPNDGNYFVRDLRFDALVNWIQKNDPDIVVLTEAWSYRDSKNVAETLAKNLEYDVIYRLEMGLPHFFFEAVAVLSKKSLHMTHKRNMVLPHSAPIFGDGKTWVVELGAVSYAVGAQLKLPNGDPLFVYGTHLTGGTAADRADQAQAVVADAKSWASENGWGWDKAHVIIAGDFNSTPQEPASMLLRAAGFEDSFDVAHPGDPSCTECERPDLPWFNPFTLAAGMFPSQAAESGEDRLDYIYVHSPELKSKTSTLTFTAPFRGVWMSDHYGVTSVISDGPTTGTANPVHDSDGSIPKTKLMMFDDNSFVCPWQTYPGQAACQNLAPNIEVNGPRGITIKNNTQNYLNFYIDGPGYIFPNRSAGLYPGDQATYTFNAVGEFKYSVDNTAQVHNQNGMILQGRISVKKTGL